MFLRTPQATSQPQDTPTPVRALQDLMWRPRRSAGLTDTFTRRFFRRLTSILAQRTG